MRNVQQRIIAASIDEVGALLDTVGGPNDRLWPAGWPPMVLDAGLEIGSHGGHGPIRYSVSEYEPGRRVRFIFDPGIGLNGYHEFSLTAVDTNNTLVTHTINSTLSGKMILLWPIAIRAIHVAVLHDLLDGLERTATGHLNGTPARWSPWVRMLRRVAHRSATRKANAELATR
jgi:hypothetical protein